MIFPGEKYLITTDRWFYSPDGNQYRAVWGTVHAVVDAKATLGVDTNRNSTNWYVVIGDMIVAGCQIFYAIRADQFDATPPIDEVDHNGERHFHRPAQTRIYNADASGLQARPPMEAHA